MGCYANAAGNTNAHRTTRAKHYVIFDRAEDNSAALRARHSRHYGGGPVNGQDALPFSVAARLILVLMVKVDHPEVALFTEFPTAQLLSRLWSAVVPAHQHRGGRHLH